MAARLVAGLALLALAFVWVWPSPAGAQSSRALAMIEDPIFAPHLLSAADAALYRQIFTLQEAAQEAADWEAADAAILDLQDRRLVGHLLYQRYMHPTGWRSSWEELAGWLELYSDHPGAAAIHRLARRRQPSGVQAARAPATRRELVGAVELYGFSPCPEPPLSGHANSVRLRLESLFRQDRPAAARSVLQAELGRLGAAESVRLRTLAAAGSYYLRTYPAARALAAGVVEDSGGRVPLALWIAGLSAWRDGEMAAAAEYFSTLAMSECATPWQRSAGAFWAGRSHLRAGNPAASSLLVQRASKEGRTFYGLVARRLLGLEYRLAFTPPALTDAGVHRLAETGPGRRAVALIQIGHTELAEDELSTLPVSGDPALQEALIALAQKAGLARLAYRLASRFTPTEGGYYDGALYPVSGMIDDAPRLIDQALLHAVVRQESRFDPRARSSAGARGLMQIMEAAATDVTGIEYRGQSIEELSDPSVNLQIGQRYVQRLFEHPAVGDNLLAILLAYNAGPGNVGTWRGRDNYDDDPLLFVESVPSPESRNYAKRVLTNLWIYRLRLGLPVPTLDMLAQQQWPTYTGLQTGERQVVDIGPGISLPEPDLEISAMVAETATEVAAE